MGFVQLTVGYSVHHWKLQMPRDSLVPEWGQLSGAIQALRDSVTQRRRFTGVGDSEGCVEERGLLRDVEECMKSAEESMVMTRTRNSGDPPLSRFPHPPTGILHLPLRNGSSVGSSPPDSRTDEQPSDDSDGESIEDPESEVDVAFTEDVYANIIAHLLRELERDMSAQDYKRAERTYKSMERRYVDREIHLNIPFDNRSEQREKLVEIYLKQGCYRKAKRVLVRLLHSIPLEAERKWRLFFLLAHAYYGLRELPKAERFARGSLTGRDNLFGTHDPLTQESAMLVIAIIQEQDEATAMALRGYYCPHTIPPPPPKSALRSAQRRRETRGSPDPPDLLAESYVPQPRENEEESQPPRVRWAPDVWASDSGINAPTESGRTKLIDAIYMDDEQYVRLILSRKPSVETPCVDAISPLMHAVMCEQKGMVEALLTHGAQVDAAISGWTALHKATHAGNTAIMQLLLAHGADIEATAPFEYHPPITAKERIRAIAQDQPDPISFDEKEKCWTPLLRAASKGDEAAVRLLLDRDANIHARSPTNGTPLLHACETMHFATVDLLLMRGSDIHAQDDYGWTPLHRALVKRSPESPALLQRLVDQNCEVNARCKYRQTPLHHAVEKSDGPAVTLLLKNGGDMEARDAAERTPLHTAIERRSEAMVRLLLDLGADAMAMDRDGRDAEKAANHADRKSPEIISLLKSHKQRLKKESSQKKAKEKGPSSRKGSVGEVRIGQGGGAGGDADGGSSTPRRDKSSRLLGRVGSVGNEDGGGDSYNELAAAQTWSPAKRDKSIWSLGKARMR